MLPTLGSDEIWGSSSLVLVLQRKHGVNVYSWQQNLLLSTTVRVVTLSAGRYWIVIEDQTLTPHLPDSTCSNPRRPRH